MISPNVNRGSHYAGDSLKRNMILGFNEISSTTIKSKGSLTVDGLITSKNIDTTLTKKRAYKNIDSYAEGATVTLLSVAQNSGNNMQGVLGTIKLYIRATTNVGSFLKLGEQKFTIKQTGNATPFVDVLSEVGHTMTWNDLTLTTICGSNGTNTTTQIVYFELELFGHSSWGSLTIDDNFTEI